MLSATSIIEKMQSLSPTDELMRDSLMGVFDRHVQASIEAGAQMDGGMATFKFNRAVICTETTNGGKDGALTARAINAAVEQLKANGIKVEQSDAEFTLIVGGKKKGGRPKGVPNKKKSEAPVAPVADAPVEPVAPVQSKKGKAA